MFESLTLSDFQNFLNVMKSDLSQYLYCSSPDPVRDSALLTFKVQLTSFNYTHLIEEIMEDKKLLPIAIYAPSYDPGSGGSISLHRLCHELLSMGYAAFLTPWHPLLESEYLAKRGYRNLFIGHEHAKQCIVVYPEVTIGNPVGSDYLIRWCLSNPKELGGDGVFGENDIVMAYSDYFKGPGMIDEVVMVYDPNLPEIVSNCERRGEAFTVRKGGRTPKIPETKYLLELSNPWPKSIEEYAAVFSRIERFYSYDIETYLSLLAAYCGCESIVIPRPGLTDEEWRSTKVGLIHGVSYGLKYSAEIKLQIPKLKEKLLTYKESNKQAVNQLIKVIEREWGVGVLPLKQINRAWVKKTSIPFKVKAYSLPDTVQRVQQTYYKIVSLYNARGTIPKTVVFCDVDQQSLPFVTFVKGIPDASMIDIDTEYVIFYRGPKSLDLSNICMYISWIKVCPYWGGLFFNTNEERIPYNKQSADNYLVFILPGKLLELMDFRQESVFVDFFDKIPDFGYILE